MVCDDAEARVEPCAEAVELAREARAVLIALDDSRVLELPKVRAAADWRASPPVRDRRVPSVATGAAALRVDAPRGADIRADAVCDSRCSWRALVALLPRIDARAVNERSGWLLAQSLRMMRSP